MFVLILRMGDGLLQRFIGRPKSGHNNAPDVHGPSQRSSRTKIWESGDLLVTVYCDHATRDSTKPVSQDPRVNTFMPISSDSFHNTDSLMTNNPYLAFGVTYNGIDYDIPDIKNGACLDKQDDKWGDYKEAACNGVTIQKTSRLACAFVST